MECKLDGRSFERETWSQPVDKEFLNYVPPKPEGDIDVQARFYRILELRFA